jgi:hypothetical protein
MTDRPIHLRQYDFFKEVEHAEDSVTVPVWITQSSLDGMIAMIHYCKGLDHAGKGRVPGSDELITFYRTIRHSIDEQNKEYRLDQNEKETKDA